MQHSHVEVSGYKTRTDLFPQTVLLPFEATHETSYGYKGSRVGDVTACDMFLVYQIFSERVVVPEASVSLQYVCRPDQSSHADDLSLSSVLMQTELQTFNLSKCFCSGFDYK